MPARNVSTVSEIGHTLMCGHWFPAQRLAVLLKKKMASTKRLELISSVSIFAELNLFERRTAAFWFDLSRNHRHLADSTKRDAAHRRFLRTGVILKSPERIAL